MKIEVLSGSDSHNLTEALSQRQPDFVALHCACTLDMAEVKASAGAFHAATSCLGAMTQDGVTDGYAAFVIEDPSGAYGTGMCPFEKDPQSAGAIAVRAALKDADRLGEAPDLVWISSTPGSEELVIEGVQSVVGAHTPIIGGSAADNDVSGDWFIFDGTDIVTAGVIVSVMFPSCAVSYAYQNGYSPTSNVGTVTKVDGRSVLEIDHRRAGEVFAEWTGGAVPAVAPGSEAVGILSESTLWPLGRKSSSVGEVPFYLLAHPAVARENGALDLFATVQEGEQITSMTGTRDGLISRAGRVAALACASDHPDRPQILGALMIYCGGCMLEVRDDLPQVVTGVNEALGGAPFLGAFTFGEQGTLLGAGNRHGNLMISCVVFG